MGTGHKVGVVLKRATCRAEGTFAFVSTMKDMASGESLMNPEDSKAETRMGKHTEPSKVHPINILCVTPGPR